MSFDEIILSKYATKAPLLVTPTISAELSSATHPQGSFHAAMHEFCFAYLGFHDNQYAIAQRTPPQQLNFDTPNLALKIELPAAQDINNCALVIFCKRPNTDWFAINLQPVLPFTSSSVILGYGNVGLNQAFEPVTTYEFERAAFRCSNTRLRFASPHQAQWFHTLGRSEVQGQHLSSIELTIDELSPDFRQRNSIESMPITLINRSERTAILLLSSIIEPLPQARYKISYRGWGLLNRPGQDYF